MNENLFLLFSLLEDYSRMVLSPSIPEEDLKLTLNLIGKQMNELTENEEALLHYLIKIADYLLRNKKESGSIELFQ